MSIYAVLREGDPEALRAALAAGAPHDVGSALQTVVQAEPFRADLFEVVLGFPLRPRTVATGIGQAASKGRTALVERLLAMPHRFRDDGIEAVYGAVHGGHVDTVRALLAGGLDGATRLPDHKVSFRYPDPPEDGAAPLLLAIQRADLPMVRALVEGGVPVNGCTAKQRSPLDMAQALGHHDVAAWLEAQGAEPVSDDMLDLVGASLLGRAARVRALFPEADAAARENALRLLAKEGHDAALLEVLEGYDELLDRALGSAAAAGRVGLAEALVARGANVRSKTTFRDWTPLHFASYAGRLEMVQWLLAHGAHVKALDKDEATALHAAAQGKAVDVVAFLLSKGADPKARDDEGKTALAHSKRYAGREAEQKAIAKLLKAGGAVERSPASLKRSLGRKLAPHARPCWPLKTRKGEGSPRGTRFGGAPWLATGEAWPEAAGVPHRFLFQLDLADVPFAAGEGLLRVFLRQPDGGFRLDDTVVLHTTATEGARVEQGALLPARALVGVRREKKDRPGREAESLVAVDPAEREHLGAMAHAGDKLGGWPAWIQDADYPDGLDQLLLQVDTGGALAFSYGDSGIGMLLASSTEPGRFGMVWQSC